MGAKYSNSDEIQMGGYTFPKQKLSETSKTVEWHKRHLRYVDKFLSYDDNLNADRENMQENYDLRVNVLDYSKYKKFINPDGLDPDVFPAEFQHIGIGNTKIDLLLGDYIAMEKDFRVVISNNDPIGVKNKTEELRKELMQRVEEIVQNEALSDQEMEARIKDLQSYANSFQSTGEKVSNAILQKEFKEHNYDFNVFKTCFEDLMLSGFQIAHVDIRGKKPFIEREDPRNVITIGNTDSMFIHDQDVITIIKYKSIGRLHDEYWDELSAADVTSLERDSHIGEHKYNPHDGWNVQYPVEGSEEGKLITIPEYRRLSGSTSYRNSAGEIREVTVYWKSRRKILEVTKMDEMTGEEIKEYHSETYVPDEILGETAKVLWINEWRRATQLGEGIFVKMGPVKHATKSLTNLSYGLPPIIVVTASTNSYRVKSLMDVIKPFDIAYDIGFWKREIEVASYKGKATAVNASMIPAEFDPEQWMHYTHIDKIMYLNPHEEVNKPSSQGKPAGALSTFITQDVSLGSDSGSIEMLSNYLDNIEYTMGKISGVHGAREGEVGERSAVRNNQLEVEQFTKITQKWFALDAEFRRLVIKKFLEVCKVAYAETPERGMYLYNAIGQEYIQMTKDFASYDMDILISNSQEDKNLLQELKDYGHAAMQNGMVRLEDVVAMTMTPSMSERIEILRKSADALSQQQQQQAKEALEAQAADKEREMMMAREKNQTLIEVAMIEAGQKERDSLRKHSESLMAESSEDNSDKLNQADRHHKDNLSLEKDKLSETKRKNKADEAIKRKAANKSVASKA